MPIGKPTDINGKRLKVGDRVLAFGEELVTIKDFQPHPGGGYLLLMEEPEEMLGLPRYHHSKEVEKVS